MGSTGNSELLNIMAVIKVEKMVATEVGVGGSWSCSKLQVFHPSGDYGSYDA